MRNSIHKFFKYMFRTDPDLVASNMHTSWAVEINQVVIPTKLVFEVGIIRNKIKKQSRNLYFTYISIILLKNRFYKCHVHVFFVHFNSYGS